MRFAVVVAAPVLILAGLILGNRALAGPAAAERLAGATVSILEHELVPGSDGPDDRDLRIVVTVQGLRDVDDCLVFALDQPFGNRVLRVSEPIDGCVRARAARTRATLLFDRLTDDDRSFPRHTLVWGIRGGKCGAILPLFGVCAVDFAGTLDLELPRPSNQPSFPPLGSFDLGSFQLMPTYAP